MKKKKWPFVYVAVITVLTYIPILLTVVYSFNASKLTSVWEGFSLKWYRELFRDRDLGEALINSLILAVLSCAFAVLIGTSGALGMSRRKRKLDDAVAYVSTLPIMIPEIILGMVFLSVFSLMGLPFGMVTLVIAHTTFCVPYVFTMVRARLVGMDRSLEEAALDLGATKWQVFRDVILPQILPAILSGVLLAFAMSFDDGDQYFCHWTEGQYPAGEDLHEIKDRCDTGDQCTCHGHAVCDIVVSGGGVCAGT